MPMQISISNAIKGQINGGPSFSNLYSFSFDGIDENFSSPSNYTVLNGATNASISFWVKPTESNNIVVWKMGYASNNKRIACVWRSGNEALEISLDSSSYFWRTVNGSVPIDQWSHICWTYDGSQSRYLRPNLYVNGVLSTGSNAGVIITSLANDGILEIGGITGNFGGQYIDEFAVWNNTTLSQTQAEALYNLGEPNNLNNNGLPAPTTWFRMGDEATFNVDTWTMTDVNGGTVAVSSNNMALSNRSTDVPT